MSWSDLFKKFEVHWGLTSGDWFEIENSCKCNSAIIEVEEIRLTGPCLPGVN